MIGRRTFAVFLALLFHTWLLSQGNGKNPGQPIFSRLWGSGFIPSSHQGVQLRGGGAPILYLDDPAGIDRASRRKMLDDIAALNGLRLDQTGDPEIETRNYQYDMAYRMQASAPEITDLSKEPESTFKLYGEEARVPGTHAANCLLARRLAEQNVQFIQLFHHWIYLRPDGLSIFGPVSIVIIIPVLNFLGFIYNNYPQTIIFHSIDAM